MELASTQQQLHISTTSIQQIENIAEVRIDLGESDAPEQPQFISQAQLPIEAANEVAPLHLMAIARQIMPNVFRGMAVLIFAGTTYSMISNMDTLDHVSGTSTAPPDIIDILNFVRSLIACSSLFFLSNIWDELT